MKTVSVKYNGVEISPTPLVSRSYQFIEYGRKFGQTEQIDLSCPLLIGESSYQDKIAELNTLFAGQFKTLEVLEDSSPVYKWENLVLQEVTVDQSSFSIGTAAKYNARLVSYQIPSGVTDPVNEYSFNQSEDGTVSIVHKISAKGVRTSVENAGSPLQNAINFVNTFARKNPYKNCVPTFLDDSSGILMSINESIDRINGSYGLTENYKYTTDLDATSSYLKTSSVSVNESPENEYTTLDVSVNFQASPVYKDYTQFQTLSKTTDLSSVLSDYGFKTSNLVRDSFSITQDSGTATLEIKGTYLSGVGADMSGYFNYSVSFDKDLIPSVTNWNVDGEYISRGPLSIKKTNLAAFKTAKITTGTYESYALSLIRGSSLYSKFVDSHTGLTLTSLNVSEDTGRATFNLSASFGNYDAIGGLVQPKYSIDVEPAKWIYEMLPSANIEGHYVIQDLEMKSQPKFRLNFNSVITNIGTGNMGQAKNVLSSVSGLYVGGNSFLTEESINSGNSNISLDYSLLGDDVISTDLLAIKAQGSFSSAKTRAKGFSFGY